MKTEYLLFSRESNFAAEKITVKIAENTDSQNHSIADWLSLEGTSGGHLV